VAGASLAAEWFSNLTGVFSTSATGNLNTLAPLDARIDGANLNPVGFYIIPNIGSIPGVLVSNDAAGVTTITGTMGGTYTFVQKYGPNTTDGASTAAINSTYTTVLTNCGVNANLVSKGAAAIGNGTLGFISWTVTSSGATWSITLQYPSAAGAVWNTDTKWRRSWLFRMGSFAKPKKVEDDIAAKAVALVMEKLAQQDRKEQFVVVEQHDEKEEKKADPPAQKPIVKGPRTPGRQGGPNCERPPTPKESVAAILSETNNQNDRKNAELEIVRENAHKKLRVKTEIMAEDKLLESLQLFADSGDTYRVCACGRWSTLERCPHCIKEAVLSEAGWHGV
jgi:hypothetical protein